MFAVCFALLMSTALGFLTGYIRGYSNNYTVFHQQNEDLIRENINSKLKYSNIHYHAESSFNFSLNGNVSSNIERDLLRNELASLFGSDKANRLIENIKVE